MYCTCTWCTWCKIMHCTCTWCVSTWCTWVLDELYLYLMYLSTWCKIMHCTCTWCISTWWIVLDVSVLEYLMNCTWPQPCLGLRTQEQDELIYCALRKFTSKRRKLKLDATSFNMIGLCDTKRTRHQANLSDSEDESRCSGQWDIMMMSVVTSCRYMTSVA